MATLATLATLGTLATRSAQSNKREEAARGGAWLNELRVARQVACRSRLRMPQLLLSISVQRSLDKVNPLIKPDWGRRWDSISNSIEIELHLQPLPLSPSLSGAIKPLWGSRDNRERGAEGAGGAWLVWHQRAAPLGGRSVPSESCALQRKQ